ncbi:MAG: YlmC/YmxH family sporulation protein [Christensenellaceae bacterium]|jgi:YlmC/YmxH family sporulation protein|nr:YlmC/YmxH family sporulation protein [Christensenellaceae bacterium]
MNGIDYTFCELRDKEVINIADGKQLGRIVDLGLHGGGRVAGIVVPGEKKFLKSLTSGDSIYIPWVCVIKIGDDVILVDLPCVSNVAGCDIQKC